MSDLIDRQAAIDALRKMQTYKLFSGDDMLLIDQAGAQTELMMLPHAQLGTNLAEVGTDTISRAKAIDAIDEIESEIAEGFGFEYEKWRKHFCDLPPARPEQLEQCPIYGGMCAYPSDQCYDCPRHAGAKQIEFSMLSPDQKARMETKCCGEDDAKD